LTEKILEILRELGLPGLFAGIFLESLGLPFPGSLLLALTGFLAKQGQLNIMAAWLVAMIGYMLGSTSAFLVGRHVGESFIKRWGKYLGLTPERLSTAQGWLQRSAPGFIIGGRFLPTVGNVTPYVAGISGITLVKFLLYDSIHAFLWLTLFLGAGSLLGKNWHRVADSQWSRWLWIAVVLVLLVCLLRYVHHHFKYNRTRI